MKRFKIPLLISLLSVLINFNLFVQPFIGFVVSVILLLLINCLIWYILVVLLSKTLKEFKAIEWAVGVFVFLLSIYGYGALHFPQWVIGGSFTRGLDDVAAMNSNIELYKKIYYPSLILIPVLFYFISSKEKIRVFLNTFLLSFIAVVFINKGISYYKTYSGFIPKDKFDTSHFNKDSITVKPDIYFYLFDGYTGNTALKEFWNFDNHEYKDSLIRIGFQVADSAQGNYPATIAALSSMFNFSMFQNPQLFNYNMDLTIQKHIKNNQLFTILKHNGYAVHTNSFLFDKKPFYFSQSDVNPRSFFFANTITRHLLYRMVLKLIDKIIENPYDWISWYYEYDKRVEVSLDKQINPTQNQPTFFYNHLMLTHTIYRYDSAGKHLISNTSEPSKQNYIDQIKYNNLISLKYFSALVDSYTKQNKPLVIIALSDHGSRELKNRNEEKQIQLIVYDSEKKMGEIATNENPINLFRQLMNAYFGYQMPTQQNEYYDIYSGSTID